MKILYIDQTGKLGGGEIALLPILEQRPKGARLLLLEDGPFRGKVESLGIPVEVLGLASMKAVRRESGLRAIAAALPAFVRLRGQIRERAGSADVIYANSQKAFLLAALAKRRGQPLVWHLRDIITAEHFSGVMRRVDVLFGNRFASVIVVNSQATADAFCAAGGRRDLVKVVYDGVSPLPFDACDGAAARDTLRRRLGLSAEPLFGVFGRLSEWKGQHVLLEALALLPGTHAVLVGDALFGEDSYVERLKDRAAQPDLAGRVHFLGFQDDVPPLMKAVDVVVHCSIAAEPFGLVIVEGMLARRPVIATRAGGAVEIVTAGSGLLVTPGDAAELAAAARGLLHDPEGAARMAENGRARAEADFSTSRLVVEIDAVLRRVLAG